MEIFDLMNQITVVGGVFGGEARGDWSLHPVGPQVENLSDFPVFDSRVQLPAGLAVPAHQANSDLEVFLLRLFVELEHFT